MRVLMLVLALNISLSSFGQKVKFIKNPVSWDYKMVPKKPLEASWKKNQAIVETKLDPMTYAKKVDWNKSVNVRDVEKRKRLYKQAVKDTIQKWAKKHLAITRYPYQYTTQAPDFTIKLIANEVKIENTQLDIDYSDKESVLCEVNATARLMVTSKDGNVLLDKQITFFIDDEDEPTNKLKLSFFMLDPIFKLKFKLTRKPTKRKRMIKRRLARYEADILEYFVVEGGKIITDYFQEQKKSVYSAVLGIKGKKNKEFSELSKSIRKSINRLSAISKKRRKTLSEIKPQLEAGIKRWEAELAKTSNPKLQQVMHHNLSVISLIIGNVAKAKEYLMEIPEYKTIDKKILVIGSYRYYLKGLINAIKLKEKYQQRASINQL